MSLVILFLRWSHECSKKYCNHRVSIGTDKYGNISAKELSLPLFWSVISTRYMNIQAFRYTSHNSSLVRSELRRNSGSWNEVGLRLQSFRQCSTETLRKIELQLHMYHDTFLTIKASLFFLSGYRIYCLGRVFFSNLNSLTKVLFNFCSIGYNSLSKIMFDILSEVYLTNVKFTQLQDISCLTGIFYSFTVHIFVVNKYSGRNTRYNSNYLLRMMKTPISFSLIHAMDSYIFLKFKFRHCT